MALLLGDEHHPGGHGLERQAAAGICLTVELRGADLDRQPDEVIAGVRRDGPLDEAQIARADHRDPLRMPGLRSDPAKRGQPVGALVEWAELTLGAERAPDALEDHLKAALGQEAAEDQPDQLPPAVRRADQHRRLWPGTRIARDPTVREQD